MSMIKVENLTSSYPASYNTIFENVNFQIGTDWKLGFVERNGRCKTAFLNLLLKKYEYRGKMISNAFSTLKAALLCGLTAWRQQNPARWTEATLATRQPK